MSSPNSFDSKESRSTVLLTDKNSANSGKQAVHPNRKRGRPRTRPSPDRDMVGSVVKKKRGRPRGSKKPPVFIKIDFSSDSDEQDESTEWHSQAKRQKKSSARYFTQTVIKRVVDERTAAPAQYSGDQSDTDSPEPDKMHFYGLEQKSAILWHSAIDLVEPMAFKKFYKPWGKFVITNL